MCLFSSTKDGRWVPSTFGQLHLQSLPDLMATRAKGATPLQPVDERFFLKLLLTKHNQ